MLTNNRLSCVIRHYELTDAQYARIEHLLAGKPGDVGRSTGNNREFLNAVLWIARSGAPWRDLPERFRNWNLAYQCFQRWARKGVWQRTFKQLQEPDLDWMMIDSSIVRVHQSASGQKSTQPDEALGRSRGGLSPKLHVLIDVFGNPLRFLLSPGQAADITAAPSLIEGYRGAALIVPTTAMRFWRSSPTAQLKQ